MSAVFSPDPPPSSSAGAPPRWTFERRLSLGYALAAALVLAMVGLCTWQGMRFVEHNRRVERTHEVIDEIEKVGELVTEAETNQRGYWILGNEQALNAAEAAIAALPWHLDHVRGLTADNPEQGERWRELEAAVRGKLARVRVNLDARRQQDLTTLIASGHVTGVGQQLRNRVRAATTEMIAVEQNLLRAHVAARRASLHAAVGSLVALGTVLVALLAVIYRLGDAELRARRRMSRELETARDEALEAARQKSEFLANMSHELRTPLNGIVGMTGLLLDRPLDAEARECADTIDTCAEALLGVINDVLDFSKIEAGRLLFADVPFDLRETMDETLTIVAARAADKGLELNVVVSPEVPAGLRGDPSRLRQVLLNLLGNAIKFTERGEVSLHVSPAAAVPCLPGDPNITLRFEVRDTGIGIAPEAVSRLFQAFSQVDGSSTRRYGGTGLGLAISRELVTRMDGEIGVESVPGVGSTFWFTVRLAPDPTLAGLAANGLPPVAAKILDGWRVLVAGDGSNQPSLLQQQLTAWGLFHQTANDGHRALAQLRLAAASGRPFDLALLDAHAPGLHGRALAAEIRADPTVANTRLVLVADLPPTRADGAAGAPASVPTPVPADFDALLPAPVRSRSLLETMRRLAAAGERHPAPSLAAAPTIAVVPPPTPAIITEPPSRRPRSDEHDDDDDGDGLAPRVLLAEDNPINRKVALRQLENLHCRAMSAANGREVLALLERGEWFDLILMDVQMPEMDGYETTRHLRSRFGPAGSGSGPRIVAMTANAMEGDREKCLAAGMDDYLPKPVKQEILEGVLRRWLPRPAHELTDPDALQPRRDDQAVSVGVMGRR